MTVSRSESGRPLRWAGAALGLILLAPVPAGAQDLPPAPGQQVIEPLPLEPAVPEPLGAPLQLLPAEPGSAGAPAATPGAAPAEPASGASGSVIQVDTLAAPNPEALGPLDASNGGLGPQVWQGTDRQVAERLLDRLPRDTRSAALRQLARRLLLSAAAPPVDSRPGAAGGEESVAFLAARLAALKALGDVQGLTELLRAVPQRYDDQAIARARVEALLLDGQTQAACDQVLGALGRFDDEVFWPKAQIACHLAAGEEAQAQLALDLMRESGAADNPELLALIGADDGDLDLAGQPPPSVLRVAFHDGGFGPVTAEQIAQADPALLGILAGAEGLDLALRAQAAERGVGLGYLDPEVLVALYRAYQFDPDDLAHPITAAQVRAGLPARALLYQAALGQSLPAVRAEILRVALEQTLGSENYGASAAVLLPLVSEIPAVPELGWFAGAAGRALFDRGRYEHANAWYSVARLKAGRDEQAAQIAAGLWPYAMITGNGQAPRAGTLGSWQAAQGQPEARDRARLALLRGLLQALDLEDPLSWAELASLPPSDPPADDPPADDPAAGDSLASAPAPAPDGAVIQALRAAGQAGRRGEAVLLSLIALGDGGPSGGHPLALDASITALAQVGLGGAARDLAIEAALGHGI